MSVKAMGRWPNWTHEQIDYVLKHYPYERAIDVGNAIGRTAGAVMHVARANRVHKDPKALRRIMSISNAGINSGNFKGYRVKNKEGYILRKVPNHPNANSRGYIAEHRLVIEKRLGCILPKEFVVHHINGIKDDNRIDNLAVMTFSAHSTLHGKNGRNIPKGKEHYRYKGVDADELKKKRNEGYSVNQICEMYGICKFTYYKKIGSE